ncbi:MAG: hypothetical protein A2992_08350 [Elusimicrobia bacterium RIFCSPLOWO2_01_FULL_59_12]|nr:MAG: hypothetical protein A2992_08350 [Elusimicrobia bacterium RIFCSPLOWO2_01_FULL_59_12]
MAELTLLRDLSVVMVTAAAMTLLCHWLKQPVVIGYLLAGLIIGPHTPPFAFIRDMHSIQTMAELGLVFLMFAIGLEFNLARLRRVGGWVVLAAGVEVSGMFGLGYALGQAFGWSRLDSFYLAAIMSISSTTIIAKVFTDLKILKEECARVAFGILILEDVLAIVLLTILSGLGATQVGGSAAVRAVGQIAFFVVLFLVAGLALVPRLLAWTGRFHSKELLGIVVLGLCLASALLANQLGFSLALGAFLMGSIVGVSSEIDAIEAWIHPIRDMFSAIFFVAAGLLIQPKLLWDYKTAVLTVAALTIAGKTLCAAAGSFLAGYSPKTSFKVGISLAQIGEFSFVFGGLALQNKQGSDFLYPLAVGVSALTTLSTPYLIRSSDRVVDGLLGALGETVTGRLGRYHQWMSGRRGNQPETAGVVSRYLIRLAIYAALFIAALSLFAFFATTLGGSDIHQALGWGAGFLLCLPLVRALATYVSHFILVVSTEMMVRFHALKLLDRLSVHRFYGVIHTGLILLFALLFLSRAARFLPDGRIFWLTVSLAALFGFLARHRIDRAYDRMEGILDEALGLATSEPLRRAALETDEAGGALSESMERIFLGRRDAAVRQSIRSLGLREKTGASLVAVYRRGKLKTNPPPEMLLLSNDTLVVMGSKEERLKARRLLKNGSAL